MKTIEITSGEQKVLFTTKSVTFDGKEFLYAHMTNVIHSTEKHIYTFTYDGEVKLLPYDEKDENTLNAIFSQVQKMAAQKKAAGQGNATEATKNAAPEPPVETGKAADVKGDAEASAKAQESAEEKDTKKETEPAAESAEAPEKKAADSTEPEKDASKESGVNVSDAFGKSKSKKSKEKKAAKAGAADTKATDEKEKAAETVAEKAADDPEKAVRRKKSLKVFGIILAILLVCSVAYYFIFGTSSAPAPTNPNTTESQQYEDIDDLINDLQ